MGLDNENAARLVFDIETFALDDAGNYLEPPTAPANYKDPQKIADYIAEKLASQVDRAALDPDLCRVVALGVLSERDDAPKVWVAREGDTAAEAAMLTRFWQLVGDRPLVGFNILGFDLPVLLRRSLYLDVPRPRIQIDRFKHPQVIDLMQDLAFGRIEFTRSLDFYSKRFGFGIEDDLTGADIAAAVRAGEWDRVEAHVTADVRKTAALAAKLGVFRSEAVSA